MVSSIKDPDALAEEACKLELVSAEVKDVIISGCFGEVENKCRSLLQSIESKVKGQDLHFHQFLAALRRLPDLSQLASELQSSYGRFRGYVVGLSYMLWWLQIASWLESIIWMANIMHTLAFQQRMVLVQSLTCVVMMKQVNHLHRISKVRLFMYLQTHLVFTVFAQCCSMTFFQQWPTLQEALCSSNLLWPCPPQTTSGQG